MAGPPLVLRRCESTPPAAWELPILDWVIVTISPHDLAAGQMLITPSLTQQTAVVDVGRSSSRSMNQATIRIGQLAVYGLVFTRTPTWVLSKNTGIERREGLPQGAPGTVSGCHWRACGCSH